MDYQDIRTLQLLEEIEQNHTPSQRYLADRLNVSLGLVNSFIKRLAKKGYFKISTIPKNRVKYILTPKGIAEKTKLTYEYIQFSYQVYTSARKKLTVLFQQLVEQGVRRVVLCGMGQVTEVAYISLYETQIEIVGIVDPSHHGRKFMNFTVYPPSELENLTFDKVLLTAEEQIDSIMQILSDCGVEDETIVVF